MPEKIGLIAELDLRQFNRNVTTYLNKINQMQTTTQNMARAVSSSLIALDGRATSSILHIANAIQILNQQTAAMKRSFTGSTGVSALTNHLRGLTQAANQAANSLSNLNRAQSSVGRAGRGSGGFGGTGGFGGIGSAIGGATSLVSGAVGMAVSAATGIAGTISSIVGKSFSVLTGIVSSTLGTLSRIIFNIIGNIASTVARIFSSMVSTVLRLVGSLVSGILNLFNSLLRSAISIVGNIVSGIVNAFTSILRSIISIASNIVSTVIGAFTSILRSVVSIVGNLVGSVVNAFTSLLGSILGIVQNIVSGIVSAFSSLVSIITNVVSGIASAITGAFSSVLGVVGNILSSLARTVVNIFSSIAKSVVSIVESMARAIISTITNMVKKIRDSLMSMARSILDAYRDLGSQLVKIITVATAAVTGALFLAGRQVSDWFSGAIQGAADFEQHMADIQAVLRATRQEIEPLGNLIDKLALDPQLVVSTNEAAAVVEQLARNGVEMTQILEGAAEAAILLANASGGEFAQAADVATMAMQMFGLAASEVNRIADVSQGVINNSRIELEDWALALGNGGAAAASLGVTFEDFSTVIAGTVNLFHSARQAGTGAMNFFQRLVPVTDRSAEALRQAGLFTGLTSDEFNEIGSEIEETEKRIADLDPRMVHYDELVEAHTQHLNELRQQMVAGNSAFFDEQGNFEGAKTVAVELAKAMKDLSIEQRRAFSDAVFGNDAYETFVGMVQLGEKELAGLEGSFSDIRQEITITNSAMDAAATRTETLQARWRNLGDIWEAIRRKSGEKFIDMLLNMVNRLTSLTNANQDRIIDFFGRMADLLDRLVDAALPWVERQLPKIIDNLEALAHWLVETVLQGDKAQYWFERMSPGMRNFMERVFATVRAIKEFAGNILDLVASLSKTFRPFIEFMLQNVELKDVLIAAAGAIMLNIVPGILRLVSVSLLAVKAVSSIRRGWEEDWGGIRSFFEETWPRIRQPLIDFINNLLTGQWRKAWEDAKEVITTVLTELEAAVPPFFKNFVNLMHDIVRGDWKGAWENIVEISKKSLELIKDLLRDLETPFTDFIVDVLEGAWGRVWAKIKEAAGTTFNWIIDQLRKLDMPFTDFIADILEGKWAKAWETVKNAARIAYDWIVDQLRELNLPFTNFIADILEGKWMSAWDKVKNVASFVFNWIKERLRELNTPFTDFILDILEGRWYEAWRTVRGVVVEAFDRIVEGLDSLDNPFTEFIVDLIRGRWFEAWEDFKEIFVIVKDGILFALDELNLPFTNFIAKVIRGDWEGAWQNVSNVVSTTFELIKTILADFDQPWSDFLLDVLEGRWGEVWTTIRDTAIRLLEELKNYLPGWGDSFVSAIQAILQGNWIDAWNNARDGVVIILNEIKNLAPNWLDPFIDVVISLLEGRWMDAWRNARIGVTNILNEIKNFTPSWLDPFIDMVVAVLDGRWKDAWNNAKEGANLSLQALKDLTPSWFDPFITAVQQILDGNWKGAWSSAVEGVNIVLGKLATLLPEWAQPFVGAVQALLKGDFQGAWDNALHGINLTLDKIKENVPTWMGNAITLLQQILAGEWSAAWDTAKTIALDALKPVKEWIDNQGKAVHDWFKINMPAATLAAETGFANVKAAWDRFVEAATKSETKTNLDNLAATVITGITKALEALFLAGTALISFFNGDWKTGWEAAGDAVKVFGELPVLNAITTWFKDTFPKAVDTFNTKMPEVRDAWEPVVTGWPASWLKIQTWWDAEFVPWLDGAFSGIIGRFQQTLIDLGVLLESAQVLFSGEGSFPERLKESNRIITEHLKEQEGFFENYWGKEIPETAKTAANNIGKSLNEGFNEGVEVGAILGDDGKPVPSGLVYWESGISGAMTKLQQDIYNAAKVAGEQTNSGYVTGLGDPNQPIVKGLNAWTQLAIDTAQEGLKIESPSGVFEELAMYTMQGFRDGILDHMKITFDAASHMTQEFIERFDVILQEIPPIAGDVLQKFAEVFIQYMFKVTDVAQDLTTRLIDRFGRILQEIPPMAQRVLEQFAMIFQQNMNRVIDMVNNLIGQVINSFTGISNAGQSAGQSLGSGLVSGLQSQLGAVQSAAASLAQAAQTGVEVQAQIASPSKVFKKLGEFMREGLVIGFRGDRDFSKNLFGSMSMSSPIAGMTNNLGSTLNTSNHSYNTYNSPIQFGPIYVSDKMSAAEFEYRVEQIILRTRD